MAYDLGYHRCDIPGAYATDVRRATVPTTPCLQILTESYARALVVFSIVAHVANKMPSTKKGYREDRVNGGARKP